GTSTWLPVRISTSRVPLSACTCALSPLNTQKRYAGWEWQTGVAPGGNEQCDMRTWSSSRVFRKTSGLATRPTAHQEHPRPSQRTVRLGQCREKQQIVGQEQNSYRPPLRSFHFL